MYQKWLTIYHSYTTVYAYILIGKAYIISQNCCSLSENAPYVVRLPRLYKLTCAKPACYRTNKAQADVLIDIID